MNGIKFVCLAGCFGMLLAPAAAAQTIPASGNIGPSVITVINPVTGMGMGPLARYVVEANVDFDLAGGPWIKQLPATIGLGQGVSGERHPLIETMTNIGTERWTDWHEVITSTTNIGDDMNPIIVPGYLFDKDSLNVFRNGTPLVRGTDYTLMTTDNTNGGIGDPGDWSAIWIFFAPGREINPGQQLRIEKQIYEVSLDANTWNDDEFAEIAQHPSIPEPATALMCLCGAISLALVHRRRRSQ